MKMLVVFLVSVIASLFSRMPCLCASQNYKSIANAIIIDHINTDIRKIPQFWVVKAKSDLHIVYGHTSHGSQIITGMTGLVSFAGDLYAWNDGGLDGALDLKDGGFEGAEDLGSPDGTAWESATRTYLISHPAINVVIWSWCGQVSSATTDFIDTYLNLMNELEKDYPSVRFVYMTGHTDGTGLSGNLHIRNQQIRLYCEANNKILYDFEDIESYDPDGRYFGDKNVSDDCSYSGGNWAVEWQNSHTKDVDWYECESAHSQPLNANLKACAAWWLWARLAGWNLISADLTISDTSPLPSGSVGTPYRKQLSATDGVAPYHWSIQSGSPSLPAGLTISDTGLIYGTPTATGTFNFAVQVTDSKSPTPTTADKILSIVINPAALPTGDINGDGLINITDVILCLRQAIGLDTTNPVLADINGDGFVNITDVIFVLRKAIGLA